MKTIRKAADRGVTKLDWLDARHSFSFGRYVDRDWMGFGPLRVINNDTVAPGGGFATHGHDNMEIITYILNGALSHKDSLGSGSTISDGQIQVMSAGSGIEHCEFNASGEKPVHLYQIWLLPNERDAKPTYQEDLNIGADIPRNELVPVVSPDGRNNTMTIRQDAYLSIGHFDKGLELHQSLDSKRKYWVQVVEGNVTVNDVPLTTADGLGLSDESSLSLISDDDARILFFDMSA